MHFSTRRHTLYIWVACWALLNYCNSLLIGLENNQINRLQWIQNNATQIVSQIKKIDHISPVLAHLHWLPVKKRIQFKMLLMTYRCLHDMAPQYLSELLTLGIPLLPNYTLLISVFLLCLNQDLNPIVTTLSKWQVLRARNDLPLNLRNISSIYMFKKQQ